MGGLFGSLLMLLEASNVGARLDIAAVPRPPGVDPTRWLLTFPSYGFLLSVAPGRRDEVLAAFAARELAAAVVGSVDASRALVLSAQGETELAWDLSCDGLTRRVEGARA
jgi:selenophosphate synthetase-related protein